MTIQRVQPGKRMSQAVVHGDTVYLAGQVALDKPGASVAEQTTNILARIDALLRRPAATRPSCCRPRSGSPTCATFDEMNGVWDAWLPEGGAPARATVEAELAAPQFTVEIGIIARASRPVRVAVMGAGRDRRSPPPTSCGATATRSWSSTAGREPASETSFGNAGMIAPGHAYAWSSPQALRTLVQSPVAGRSGAALPLPGRPAVLALVLEVRAPVHQRARAYNTAAQGRLCLYSQGRLHAVVADTGVAYGGRAGRRALPPPRRRRAWRGPRRRRRSCATTGSRSRRVDPDEAAAIDPVYAPVRDRFAGALYAPGDESGDARLFTRGLADWLRRPRRRAAPRQHRSAHRHERRGVSGACGPTRARSRPTPTCWRWAARAPPSAARIGLDLPIYPIKGYSVTLPIEGRNNPPTLSGVDEDNLFAFANYGDRVRMTAIAEFAGYDTSPPAGRLRAHAAGGARAVPGRRRLRPARDTGPACGR